MYGEKFKGIVPVARYVLSSTHDIIKQISQELCTCYNYTVECYLGLEGPSVFFFLSLICQVGAYYVNKNAKVTAVALLLKSLICYYNVYLAVVIRHAIQFDGARD